MAAARRLIIGVGGGGLTNLPLPLRGIVWISQIVDVFCFHLKVMLGSSSLPPPPTQPLRSAMRWREVRTAASEGGSESVSLSFRIHVGGGSSGAWVEHQMPPGLLAQQERLNPRWALVWLELLGRCPHLGQDQHLRVPRRSEDPEDPRDMRGHPHGVGQVSQTRMITASLRPPI